MTISNKAVINPGFGEKKMDKEKFVKRWTDWAVDYMHIVDNHDEYLQFQKQVKTLAEKRFDDAS